MTKILRQGLRVSIDRLRKEANEIEKELKQQCKELGLDEEGLTSQSCMISIINKEPECSDTWTIE